jgi:hypothetical protein
MRSLGGFILLAGIGVALFVYLPAPVDSGASFHRLQRVATSLPPAKFTPASGLGSFSPSVALSMPARRGPHLATAAPAPAPQPAQAPIASDTQTGWQTTVVSAATPAPTELAPRDPDARYKLVLEIQQQLRRVGCYWGRIDGSWGYATKDAMKEFTDRVNATLPLDQPDYVQLTLIQSHSDKVCGACPAGQSLSASGRCVGLPITAQTEQPSAPQIATAQKEVLPWKANEAPAVQPLFKPVPTTVVSTEPLPGRMTIGAPVPTSVDVQQSAPPVTPGAEPDPNARAPVVMSPDHRRGFAGDAPPQRARSYRHEGPGTPHYNLMLSLGGVY